MLIDTHIHLSYDSAESRERNILSAKEIGTRAFVAVGSTIETSRQVAEVAEATDGMYCGVAVAFRHVQEYSSADLGVLRQLIKHSTKMVCIGETGLDYQGVFFGEPATPEKQEKQRQVFRDMIRLGREFGLPLNMHSDRTSARDLLNILREEKAYEIGGMMHNYQGSLEMAKEYWDMGFYVSASVTIHHPLADRLRGVFRDVSIGQIVMDTDSPGYILPGVGDSGEPFPYNMDKVSEPRMLRYIADKLAELKEMPVEEVEAMTSLNAKRLFNLPTTS